MCNNFASKSRVSSKLSTSSYEEHKDTFRRIYFFRRKKKDKEYEQVFQW